MPFDPTSGRMVSGVTPFGVKGSSTPYAFPAMSSEVLNRLRRSRPDSRLSHSTALLIHPCVKADFLNTLLVCPVESVNVDAKWNDLQFCHHSPFSPNRCSCGSPCRFRA